MMIGIFNTFNWRVLLKSKNNLITEIQKLQKKKEKKKIQNDRARASCSSNENHHHGNNHDHKNILNGTIGRIKDHCNSNI